MYKVHKKYENLQIFLFLKKLLCNIYTLTILAVQLLINEFGCFMKNNFFSKLYVVLTLFVCLLHTNTNYAQQRVKKVIFQAFWWDYWNENFRFGWANYLTELAPRLKAAGFNAIWIPPAYKNASPDFVGYMPFDNYDLGDKRQKGNGHPMNDRLRTRVGTKDDLLRMIAVMHANGIEVLHDVVLNHNGDAGGGVQTFGAPGAAGQAGAGGQDPASASMATASGFKNFRYVSYASPAINETANDYWTRSGRWAKNFQNFYSCNSGCNDINAMYWGPDINYEASAFGQSSNIPTTGTATINGITRNFYNPTQTNNYMLNNSRDWLLWLKKQTGSDGWRWDAVKHFPINVQETGTWHSKYDASLTSLQAGGQTMLNIGEWIGNQFELDNYTNNIASPTAPGGVTNERHTGTFDFGLRGYNTSNIGGLYQLVHSNGAFNMAALPGEQQGFRFFDYPGGLRVHRSVNFVNSHDTYRPNLQSNGNFAQPLGVMSGWNTGSELGGNGRHIDPREPRLFSAYAACFAMDGNPLVFFEDLFDIGTTGKRWSHLPTSTTDLPIRGDIVNLMQAHNRLAFKDGDYGVPTASNSPFFQTGNAGDHLVIERVGKAIIGITDVFNSTNNNSADQQVFCKVNDAWPVGTVLYDYSGAHGINTVTIPADRRVLIQTAPVGHTIPNAFGHGYSIWAPAPPGVTVTSVNDLYNYLASYTPERSVITQQEWEMADDLGDSHCESLGQGGALPANSTNQRVAGKIFVQGGTNVSIHVRLENTSSSAVIMLQNLEGVGSSSTITSGNEVVYPITNTGWYTIKIRQANNTTPTQKAWIRVTYTAPAVVDTRATVNDVKTKAAIWTGNMGNTDITNCGNWEEGILPDATRDLIISGASNPQPIINANLSARNLILRENANPVLQANLTLSGNISNNISGIGGTSSANIIFAGTTTQTISGDDLNVATSVQINNTAGVQLNANATINGTLTLTQGKFILNSNNLTISTTGTITGASANSYIETQGSGFVSRLVSGSAVLFPVGNTTYTPVTITNTGTNSAVQVRCFNSMLDNGTNGNTITTPGKLNKTWVVTPSNSGANLNITLQWNNTEHDGSFNPSSCLVAGNENNNQGWAGLTTATAAIGSNPYTLTANNINTARSLGVVSNTGILPVTWVSFAGKVNNNIAQLKWITSNEINNAGFYIQRSLDGSNYNNVGFVKAQENSNTVKEYVFTDEMPATKTFYRLQQIDKDGKTAYSSVIVLVNTQYQLNYQINPNPVKDKLMLVNTDGLTNNEKLNVMVTNSLGRTIKTLSGSFDNIRIAIQDVLSNQPAGLYIFSIQTGSATQHIKVLKQ